MNAATSDVVDAGLLEQLEPALERRQQLDPVAERDPRVRVERDDRRLEPGRAHGVDDGAMPAVDAVEAADRDRARRARRAPLGAWTTFTRAARAPRRAG